MKVYLSSTYIDLKDYRESFYRTLCKIEGVQVVAMEDYVACDERPVKKCLNDVEKCDAYIGLFAWRDGFIPDGHKHSITNLEYLKAFETNKPIFIFLLDENAPWLPKFIDKLTDNIVSLRKHLKDNLGVSYFKNKDDLSKEVSVVISNHLNKNKSIVQGIPPEEYQRISKDLGVTENAVKNFFKIIEQKEIPKEDWDFTLRQIATRHKELLSRLDQFNVTVDEEIQELRLKAEEAINEGDYDSADTYLDDALEKQMICITNAEKELTNCKLSASEIKSDKGDLELIRINYKAASKLFKEAVDLVPDGHEIKKAEYLQKWGDAARNAGLYTESQTVLEQCLEIRERLLPKDDLDLAKTLNNLAVLYKMQGKHKKAELLFKRSLGIVEKALGNDHPDVATILNNFSDLYRSQGKNKDAETLNQRSLDIIEKKLGKDHLLAASSRNNLANLYVSQEKYEEAEPLFQRSLRIYEKALGKDHPLIANIFNDLGMLSFYQKKYKKAEFLYKKCLEIREKKFGKDHPDIATLLNNLAALYRYQKNYEKAESLYQRSIGVYEKVLGKDHPDIANPLNNLAALYEYQGKYEEAKPLYMRSIEIVEKALGKDHPNYKTFLQNYSLLSKTK